MFYKLRYLEKYDDTIYILLSRKFKAFLLSRYVYFVVIIPE